MSISHFPASVGAHVGATVETKRNGEDEEQRQGFIVHTLSGAQGVRAVAAAVSAAMVIAGFVPLRTAALTISEQFAHGIHRVEIDAVRAAAQQFLGH